VTAPQQAMDAIDSSFASHLRQRTLRAKGVLRMTHAPLFRIRVKATFPPDTRGLLLQLSNLTELLFDEASALIGRLRGTGTTGGLSGHVARGDGIVALPRQPRVRSHEPAYSDVRLQTEA
jgi:hypothetical protein